MTTSLVDLLSPSTEWQEQALCAQTDPEAFYPEKGVSPRAAKRICARCEVKAECLEYALETNQQFGVFGGKTRAERELLSHVDRKERNPR